MYTLANLLAMIITEPLRKFGKFGNHMTARLPWQSRDRLPARPHHRYTNANFRVVCGEGFLVKMNGSPRFVKRKQLRSSGKPTQNKKKFMRNLLL